MLGNKPFKLTGAAIAVLAVNCISANAQEGSKSLFPKGWSSSFVISEAYSDNIFSTRNNKVTDFITTFAPSLGYTHDGEKLDFSIGGSAEIGRYARTPSENYEDYRVYFNGKAQLAPGARLITSASHARNHEERSSPDDVSGTSPTIYDLFHGHSVFLGRSGANSVRIGATVDLFNFDDSGLINNDDRDRDVYSAGARFDHRTSKTTRFYVEGLWDGRNYKSSVDDNGFNRDSDGVRASIGVVHRFSPTLRGELYGGWLYQNYSDNTLKDVSTIDIGGILNWTPVPGGTFKLSVDRSLEETTTFGASSYVRTEFAAGYNQKLNERTQAGVSIGYVDRDYWGISRKDRVLSLKADGRYYFLPHIFAGLSYEYQNLDSNVTSNNYDRSIIMARLGLDLEPAYKEGSSQAPIFGSESPFDYYVGAKVGLATPGTDLAGPRGNGGSLLADFSDMGIAGSIFAGIGTTINSWYTGVEADLAWSGADWNHARSPGGRVFGVANDFSYGLSAIFGRKFMNNGLLFGRAGFKVADQDTTYFSSAGTPFPKNSKEFGLRFGLGLQAPVSPNLDVRMEYEYTAFNDYNMVIPSGTDNFANTEGVMSLGVVYHFGQDANSGESKFASFDGFYVGAQGGIGSLLSATTGPRDAGSVLNADFGDMGITGGIFAGYTAQIGRLVIGGEIDAELSDARWDHVRDPTGRTYSMEKQYSFGASLLVGAVVGNSALLYARAGVVQSDMKHRFARGAQNVVKTNSETGLRVGAGLELPVMEKLSIRTDLSFTDYGKTNLFIPGAGNGTERYDTTETLFRIGAILRF